MEPCYGDKASGIGGGWSSPAGDIGYLEIWEAEAKSSAEKNLLKTKICPTIHEKHSCCSQFLHEKQVRPRAAGCPAWGAGRELLRGGRCARNRREQNRALVSDSGTTAGTRRHLRWAVVLSAWQTSRRRDLRVAWAWPSRSSCCRRNPCPCLPWPCCRG